MQAEYNQTLQQEHLTEPTFNSLQPDNQTSSLNLMDYLLPPENPDGMEFDFEIPDSDSGEQKTGEEKIELDPKEMLKDSTEVLPDSLLAKDDSLKVDTVKIDWRTLDSTARLEQFRFQREEKPYIEAGEKKQSKFFAQPTTNLKQRSVKIDSTGQFVEVREKIGTHEPKLVLRMPLEDYINLKLGLKEREDWEKLAYAYELKSGTVGLGELITSFTDFEIPLPSVGVLSIFGEPKISLKIGGSVQIHGAWRNETTEGVTANRLGNTRNEPDFKQQVQINVSGTIGDKLNINADWNTERTFEYENQLKIKYTGYEDEIIQSIEAGNVSMQTPSLIGGAEALFGVKALFQMGPFKLTTLASQKKGETKEVAVSGGSTSQEYSVRAYDYSENHYFIDKVYSDRNLKIFENYYANIPSQYNPEYNVNEIEVWKSINQVVADQSKIRYANCFIDLPTLNDVGGTYPPSYKQPLENPIAGQQETGRFLKLEEGTDYILHPETGYLSFKTALNEQDIIAVAFKQGPNNVNTYGQFLNTITQTDTLIVLKLVKPRNLQPSYREAWSLRLKNIYPTGARNIKQEGFEFKIKYEIVGQEPSEELQTTNGNNVRLIQAFGFDQQGSGGSPVPDNIFDWRPGLTIFPETGEVIFPTLEPFGKDIPAGLEDKVYQSIYDTTKTYARQDKGPDKWIFNGKNTGTSSATYQLGFNIVENSVKVRLNGRELKEGTDYTVDYNIGQLTIRNEAALVPGADLKITYEQNDLFQLASKTLLGARGIYDFSDKTQLGFTVMNLNQETLSDKVRIGEEPLSNTIYGLDFKTSADLPFITNALDFLISTKDMSTFTFNGEFAHMSPDPNTKKSTIPADAGKSIAYVDDFEGAKRVVPIGVNYTGWKDLSVPEGLNIIGGLSRLERMDFKAKSIWFTVTPSDVVVDSIYGGRKQVARSDQQITVLDYVFLPDTPGTYNWNPDLVQKQNNWGGMQRLLSSTANNLVEQNIEFLEFWMQIKNAPAGASLNIDLGVISEDVIPNNRLDSEDKNFNDAIDEGEDTGLDGEFDAQERVTHSSTKSDPSGDDFTFSGEILSIFDYFNINGTEGNAVLTDVGLLPDTEDLNRNGSVDLANNYYRYTVPLTIDTASNPFIAGGGWTSSNWFLYRIPLKDTSSVQGSPSFSNVETIRMFVQGVDSLVWVRITEFNLVGNQWQKLVVNDSVLAVSTVSYEENQRYTSPPGVFRERDRTRPDEEIYNNEQALSLVYTDLPEGESREAVKYLFRPLDVFSYKEMKLYIHGDLDKKVGGLSYNDPLTGKYSAEAFFRFGTDTANYYEYRQPVDSGWTSVSINFADLTAIKVAAAVVDSTGRISVPVPGSPGHYYILKGNPTLTAIKFLSVGVLNLNDPTFNPGPLSGEVWINEIRVVGADDTPGSAFTFSTSLKLADLMTVNFNASHNDPYFHRLSERFGSRVENQNWSVSTDLDVLKIFPFNMRESNLKVNYSHTESLGKPLYIPGTDVKVDEAADQLVNVEPDSLGNKKTPEQLYIETQTLSVTNSISSSNIKLKIPTDLWYIRDTWNSLSFGFNYSNRFNRSPTVLESTSWLWNASTNYAFNFSPDLYIKLSDLPVVGIVFSLFKDYKDLKIYFAPQNFSANFTANRNRNSNQTRPRPGVPTDAIVSQDFTTGRGFNFNWKLTEGGLLNLNLNYNVNMNSTLANLLLDSTGAERTEGDIWNDIINGAGFGQDYRYQQSFDLRTSPKLPSLWDINRFFTLNAGYSVGYRWDYDLRQEDIGRSAGNTQKFTAGMVLRWKSLTEPLFGSEDSKEKTETKTGTNPVVTDDTSKVVISDKPSSIGRAFQFLVSAIKYVFFDWENFTFNYGHDYSVSKSGIKGTGTGFYNFWGITQSDDNGPSRAFQLGLSSDVGPRSFVPNANTNLSDIFTEKNSIDFKTARPLWEGAKIDINWNVNWSENKNVSLNADGLGNITITNTTATGSLTRSFLSLPPSLPLVESGIKKVFALYNPNSADPRKSLSDAFVEGFETLPILSNLPMFSDVNEYIPRANWRITWDGLEKILFFKSLAERISLEHSYSSTYTEGWKLSAEGNQEIQTQRVEYGFTPFVGLNITFGQVWGGNLNGTVKFSSRTTYDLSASTTNINETLSRDIGFTASFSKSGFEIPLFGVSLKNDVEFLVSYTSTKNSVVRYEMNNFTEDGIPQDGTTRTTIEPRIKYTISSKVSLSIYYKRSTVEPEGAARIPPTTTNEAGLDVNIVIQ